MNRMVISADQGKNRISKHIYGHFSEHLGRCIYGGYWVGVDSPIPNRKGIRTDIVEALKQIQVPNLRWPGGCFADEYHWKDGIGPREERPSMVNSHWGGVTENNHFGTHEFMELCAQIGCEPYINGNLGSGTVQEMSEWVEYLNSDGVNPMADLRRRNGREEPWGVRYFGVGNENWGCGGHMRPEYYADLYRRYQTYCRNCGKERLYKIACGPNSDDYRWTEVLMREAGRFMDGLSVHYYCGTGRESRSATDFGEGDWFHLLQKSLKMDELITRHSAIMDQYDPAKRVGMIVDEWGTWHAVEPGSNPGFLYQQNALRDALVAGITLNIFNHHCARVEMANLAQTVNVLQALILTEGESMILTPTYHVFDLYKGHMEGVALPFSLDTEEYRFGEEGMPQLHASASRAKDGRVTITLCNLNPQQGIELDIEVRGVIPGGVTGQVLTGPEITSHNTFDAPKNICPVPFTGLTLDGHTLHLSLPSKSVVSLCLEAE